MRRSLLAIGISFFPLVLIAFAEATAQQGKRQISLKEIWAYKMPGTRDVCELEPDKFGPSIRKLSSAEQLKITGKSLTARIGSHLQLNKPGQTALQAFAVAGTGTDALRAAEAVLSGDKKPQTSFPADSNISVIFFSHAFGYYVHVNKVETEPGSIRIFYRFVPHETKEITKHFALIPLGKLSPGDVQVDIRRSPMEKKFVDAGFTEPARSVDSQVIAQPFHFTVIGK